MESPNPKSRFLKVLLILFVLYGLMLAAHLATRFQGFNKHAYMTEGKGYLAALYSSEHAYFEEFKTYYTDIKFVGFVPLGNERYLFGFSERCPHIGGGFVNTAYSAQTSTSRRTRLTPEQIAKVRRAFLDLPCPADFPAHWEAYAVGDIGTSTLDIWKIDEQKKLTHVQDGLQSTFFDSWTSVFIAFIVSLIVVALAKAWSKVLASSTTAPKKNVQIAAMAAFTLIMLYLIAAAQVRF